VAYATTIDLTRFGLSGNAVADADPADLAAQLDAASSLADSYLRLHYALPIVAPYPVALVEAVARIAAFNVLSVRGYNPEGDAGLLEGRYKAAIRWLEDVGAGKAAPLVADANGPAANAGGPFVIQSRYDSVQGGNVIGPPSPRGW
jgi:phage gp36-like protein